MMNLQIKDGVARIVTRMKLSCFHR
jgi:hypothetical protein